MREGSKDDGSVVEKSAVRLKYLCLTESYARNDDPD